MLSIKLNDYVLFLLDVEGDDIIDNPDAVTFFIDSSKFSSRYKSFLAAVTSEEEPVHFRDAVAFKEWCYVMGTEIDALEINKTWNLTTFPLVKKAIGCRWVYKIKYRADGLIERYMARLVVLGNKRKTCVDFIDTFAPVVKMSTTRIILGVTAAKD